MNFRMKPIRSDVFVLYGFEDDSRVHKFVLTIDLGQTVSKLHAMLSRPAVKSSDLLRLWDAIRSVVSSEYIEFEVFSENVRFYQRIFDVVEIRKSKTFDGYDSTAIRIKHDAKLKFKDKK